jgi:hypothetical protein
MREVRPNVTDEMISYIHSATAVVFEDLFKKKIFSSEIPSPSACWERSAGKGGTQSLYKFMGLPHRFSRFFPWKNLGNDGDDYRERPQGMAPLKMWEEENLIELERELGIPPEEGSLTQAYNRNWCFDKSTNTQSAKYPPCFDMMDYWESKLGLFPALYRGLEEYLTRNHQLAYDTAWKRMKEPCVGEPHQGLWRKYENLREMTP